MKIKLLACMAFIGLSAHAPLSAQAWPNLPIPMSSDDVPSRISATISASQALVLRLPSNSSTGYSWSIKGKDENFATVHYAPLQGMLDAVEASSEPLPPLPGSPELTVMTFPKLEAGHHTFQLEYGQSWMKNVPKQTVLLNLTVQ